MTTESSPAIQDFYPPELSFCYGCGRLNPSGLQIKSRWADDTHQVSIARFMPRPEHSAIPGFVYGGLLASLVDCHGTGTAAMAAYDAEQRPWDSLPANRFVTASLHTNYHLPTPHKTPDGDPLLLLLTGQVTELKIRSGRVYKVIVAVNISTQADDFQKIYVSGEVVAVQMPDHFISPPPVTGG